MARTGVYKWDVKEARDRLVKEGKHPSIDAVRAALGDTGSKSTIHRYLKELEQEGEGLSTASLSESLQGLVSQLAERLKHEAELELQAANARFDADRAALRTQIMQAQDEASRVRTQLERTEVALAGEREAHSSLGVELQTERTRTVQLTEQVQGLEHRLTEQAAYRQSLEEKHEHARQALEHFRTAAKEQRDLEQRRHEQQVQQLQAEIRVLNGSLSEKLSQLAQTSREAAALSTENSGLRSQLQESRSERERLDRDLAKARDAASQSEGRCTALEKTVEEVRATVTGLQGRIEADLQRIRDLELAAVRETVQKEQTAARIEHLETELDWITKLAAAAGISGSAESVRKMSPDAIQRMETLRKETRRVLERDSAAELWIYQRNTLLGDVAPVALLNSDDGLSKAMALLGRIEHGLPV